MSYGELLIIEDAERTFEYCPRLANELLPVARQLFEGVDFMHKKGVRHNDLNWPNVVIEEETGRASILGFGLSHYCGKAPKKGTLKAGSWTRMGGQHPRSAGVNRTAHCLRMHGQRERRWRRHASCVGTTHMIKDLCWACVGDSQQMILDSVRL